MTTNQYPLGITNDMIAAGKSVFLAMAHEQLVRPIVEGYEAQILEENNFQYGDEWREHGIAGKVTERKRTYLMGREHFLAFIELTYKARDAHNLKVSRPDNCPLLEAEHLRMQAENNLLQQLAKLPRLEAFGKAMLTLDQRKKAIDAALSLLAPFVGDAKHILAECCAA